MVNVRRLIEASIAVIIDLSEAKPNVLYETGYVHALSKPTVHICSTPMSGLPFDVRNWNTLKYTQDRRTSFEIPSRNGLKGCCLEHSTRTLTGHTNLGTLS